MNDLKMIAYCGINCKQCPAYIATKTNDNELRRKTAKEWGEIYNTGIKEEDINCLGCKNKLMLFSHCKMCDIRKCGIEMGVETCGHCSCYSCLKISRLHEALPKEKELLDKIKRSCSKDVN